MTITLRVTFAGVFGVFNLACAVLNAAVGNSGWFVLANSLAGASLLWEHYSEARK